MEKSMKRNLFTSLKAIGLPLGPSEEIGQTIIRWYDSSGPEWTNSRLKGLLQWYETFLAGQPECPEWFSHSRSNLPKGVWGWLFRWKNPGQVIAILSLNTLFKESTLTETQKEKFLHGLAGNGNQGKVLGEESVRLLPHPWKGELIQEPTLPDVSSMTGKTAPGDHQSFHLSSLEDRLKAWYSSWESVPQCTLDFLDEADHLDWIPIDRLTSGGYGIGQALGGPVIGKISIIQEPCLKARTVANPNRVTQHLLRPLEYSWESIVRSFPSDCTINQDQGIRWTQMRLQEGVTLSGSDLTSATDLISLSASLQIAEHLYGDLVAYRLFGNLGTPSLRRGSEQYRSELSRYRIFTRHFERASRGQWFSPVLGDVSWTQGQPLGLSPSFALLAITNNCLGFIAAKMAGFSDQEAWEQFRVIGDDIIMTSQLAPHYHKVLTSIGGEVNLSKTLTSNKVAEFAGRIILPNRWYLKHYRIQDPSDQNFMAQTSSLGAHAYEILRPRQRRMWEIFKYIPGIVVDGPFSQDSFGAPLEDRWAWYLTQVLNETEEPDEQTMSVEYQLLLAKLYTGGPEDMGAFPWPLDDAYLASSNTRPPEGDPRLINGQTTLAWLESIANAPGFQDFPSWVEENRKVSTSD